MRLRPGARRRLGWLFVALPLLVAVGAYLASALAPALSRTHMKVLLAERVWMEEAGEVEGTTDASSAFRGTGRTLEDLYAEADAVRRRFRLGGALAGAYFGLVIGMRLLTLSVRRTRADYTIDRAACLSCGRCFASCPKERQRQKAIEAAQAPAGGQVAQRG